MNSLLTIYLGIAASYFVISFVMNFIGSIHEYDKKDLLLELCDVFFSSLFTGIFWLLFLVFVCIYLIRNLREDMRDGKR